MGESVYAVCTRTFAKSSSLLSRVAPLQSDIENPVRTMEFV